jgi:hypothetical protein
MKRIPTILACLCLALAFAAPAALAQSPTEDAYTGVADAEDVAGTGSGSGTAPAQTADDDGTLPFTGLELSLFALVGVALVGGGYAIRRVSRGPAGA